MHIEYFQDFIVLAEELNYHSAAKRLHLSQATLSKHIAALESTYGVRLFNRDKTHVRLTGRGQILLECAADIWRNFEDSKELFGNGSAQSRFLILGGQLDNPLELGTVSRAFERFRLKHPACLPQVVPCTNTAPKVLTASLREHEADCVFFLMDNEMVEKLEEDLDHALVARYPIDAIVNVHHHLAGKERLEASDLSGNGFIKLIGTRFTPAWKILEKQLRSAEIAIRTVPMPAVGGYDYTSIDPEENILLIAASPAGNVVFQHPECTRIRVNPEILSLELHAVFFKENRPSEIDDMVEALRESYAEAFAGQPEVQPRQH